MERTQRRKKGSDLLLTNSLTSGAPDTLHQLCQGVRLDMVSLLDEVGVGHCGRVVIHDHPAPIALDVSETIPCGKILALALFHPRERVIAGIDGRTAVHPDERILESHLARRQQIQWNSMGSDPFDSIGVTLFPILFLIVQGMRRNRGHYRRENSCLSAFAPGLSLEDA